MDGSRSAPKDRGLSSEAGYQPISSEGDDSDAEVERSSLRAPGRYEVSERVVSRVSWVQYSIFALLGIAMLWAWNMFLAAAPYFQMRFKSSDWLLAHFQSAIISNSSIASMVSMLLFTRFSANASYPNRLILSLLMMAVIFALLATSTVAFTNISPEGYFAFLMVMVLVSGVAVSLCQNGLFAFTAGFEKPEYMQAVMAGQGIAGVLPCIVQIVSVLSISPDTSSAPKGADGGTGDETATVSPKSAFVYFVTAVGVAVISLLAFLYLLRTTRTRRRLSFDRTSDHQGTGLADEQHEALESENLITGSVLPPEEGLVTKSSDGTMLVLFWKLKWFVIAIVFCFAITMFFPVFTQEIVSVRTGESGVPRLLQPACFIPLGFLVWNAGDLIGRCVVLLPWLYDLLRWPKTVLGLSLARVAFIPLFYLCNIRGRGAAVDSDLFYLLVLQLPFGITNGYLGSLCMIAAPLYVSKSEKQVAGGFMGLWLMIGITVGSLLSFVAAEP